MPVVGQSNFDAADTAYRAAYEEFFAGGPEQVSDLFTETIPTSLYFTELDVTTAFPRVREWVGSKVYKDFRAQKQTIELTKWETSTSISRLRTQYSSGNIERAIRTFFQKSQFWRDDIMFTALLANSLTGYDGEALLSNSHPNVNGTTADNLTTSALSQSTLQSGIQAMEDLTDEDGTPLGVYPTHLFVGPALRKTAFDITGSDRPMTIGTTGTLDATSGVQSTIKVASYIGGQLTVVISPWITGNQWLLFDLGKAEKPMLWLSAREPEAVSLDRMDDPNRFLNDDFLYSVEADGQRAVGLWQLAYGSVTA